MPLRIDNQTRLVVDFVGIGPIRRSYFSLRDGFGQLLRHPLGGSALGRSVFCQVSVSASCLVLKLFQGLHVGGAPAGNLDEQCAIAAIDNVKDPLNKIARPTQENAMRSMHLI